MRVLVIDPSDTSTKISVFKEERGLLRHILSGTYEVDRVLNDIYNSSYGEHASNLLFTSSALFPL